MKEQKKIELEPKSVPLIYSILKELERRLKIYYHNVILRSGKESNYYIDFKESFPYLLDHRYGSMGGDSFITEIYDAILTIIKLEESSYIKYVFLAGKGLSGSILVTSISTYFWLEKLDEPFMPIEYVYPIYVRSLKKKHGIVKDVIGLDKFREIIEEKSLSKNDTAIYIIDDVLTTGETLKEIINSLILNGVDKEYIRGCIVIISRDEKIKEIDGIPVIPLAVVKE